MTDTPNTSRPSEEARDLAHEILYKIPFESDRIECDADTETLARRIDVALARARDDARREALEEGWREGRRAAQQALVAVDYKGQSGAEVWCRCHESIRALIHPTPQGETKEQQP